MPILQVFDKITCFALLVVLLLTEPLKAEPTARSQNKFEYSAVDAHGVRHRSSDYGEARMPWRSDIIKFVQPDYPAGSRARHNEGTGWFRITLDGTKGSVTQVAVLRSTGYPALDESAVRAIHLWRWRPGKWKEVDIPVAFTIEPRGRHGELPSDPIARGTTQYRKGDISDAVKTLNQAVQQEPTSAEGYIMRGATYQARDNVAKALADFNTAIQLDPKSARAYCDRAMLEDELLQQPGKALADYDQAIRFAPEFYRAFFNRGVHFFAQHDYQHAISDFNRAVQLIPSDGSAYAYRALAYARLGDRSRARADAEAAIKLKLSEPPLFRAIDLAIRAKAYGLLGQSELALRDFREAVRLTPEASVANDNLAWFLATCPNERFRNGTEAVSVAKKACELSHWQRSGCYDTLATAHAEAADFDQAVKHEKQALTDSSLASKERQEREKRLALFQQRKPFRDEF